MTLTVTIHNAAAAKAPVQYEVTLHNSGSESCAPPNLHLPPGRVPLTLGPCSQLSTVIRNSSGVNVSPGAAPYYSCPMYVGLSLAAHGTLSAQGGWDGLEWLAGPGGSREVSRAPAGNYHLVVDGKVAVPFKLVAGLGPSDAGPAAPAAP